MKQTNQQKSEKITELRGKECKCGVSFQHIHKISEGLKNPISVIDAIEQRLLENQKSEMEWEIEFEEKFGETLNLFHEKYGKKINNPYEITLNMILKDFIRQTLAQSRQQEYEKGFIAGADATGSQMNELKIEEIKEIEKKARQQFAEEILDSLPQKDQSVDETKWEEEDTSVGNEQIAWIAGYNSEIEEIKQIIKDKLKVKNNESRR